MERTRHVLIVGGDPALKEEFESAAGGLREGRPVRHYAESYREGVEVARVRQPEYMPGVTALAFSRAMSRYHSTSRTLPSS